MTGAGADNQKRLVPRPGFPVAPGGVVGVDEAGRGPLAGPVVAGAVILAEPNPIARLNDSKRLSARRREALYGEVLAGVRAAGLGWADPDEVDAVNIAEATCRAMERAVAALATLPDRIRIDGNLRPEGLAGAECVIGGDRIEAAIAAGSILAKVTRDHWMAELDRRFPGYGFARHKGYGTAEHRDALACLGPCPIHRRSFATVKRSPFPGPWESTE